MHIFYWVSDECDVHMTTVQNAVKPDCVFSGQLVQHALRFQHPNYSDTLKSKYHTFVLISYMTETMVGILK